eukprot:757294-Hanusia_phi.AAC.2
MKQFVPANGSFLYNGVTGKNALYLFLLLIVVLLHHLLPSRLVLSPTNISSLSQLPRPPFAQPLVLVAGLSPLARLVLVPLPLLQQDRVLDLLRHSLHEKSAVEADSGIGPPETCLRAEQRKLRGGGRGEEEERRGEERRGEEEKISGGQGRSGQVRAGQGRGGEEERRLTYLWRPMQGSKLSQVCCPAAPRAPG